MQADKFFIFLGILMVVYQTAYALGLALGSVVKNVQIGVSFQFFFLLGVSSLQCEMCGLVYHFRCKVSVFLLYAKIVESDIFFWHCFPDS